jgi:radical SAM protein with 4Fe4S-binding SPASM domain
MTVDMVVWELTLRCNLACLHCGSRAGRERESELTTDEALGVVAQLAQLPAREVALIGGEAYLRPDWDVIAGAIAARGMVCSMVTGGRGLDRDVALRAKRAGVASVAVSLDGLEAAHDIQRGWPGSFRAARGALSHLADAGIATSVNTQLNRLSSPDLEPLFEELRHTRIWAWRPNLTVPMGRAADRSDWLLQPWELLELYPRLAALAERCRASGIVFAAGNNIGYFGPFETVWRGGKSGEGYWQGCRAGRRILGIEADGTLKGCSSLPGASYAGGSLREHALSDLLESTPLHAIGERTARDLWGFCGDCYYADVCRAGCTWSGHVLFNRAGNNPYCHHRALVLHGRGLRERMEPAEAAPGVPFDHGRYTLILEPIPERGASDDRAH